MKKQFFSTIILFSLLIAISAHAGQKTAVASTQGAANCHSLFLPFVLTSGSAQASGHQITQATPCEDPPEPPVVEDDPMIDFNGDGFADLAVAARYDYHPAFGHIGSINVIYGSPTGLNDDNGQFITTAILQNYAARESERFGEALAAGDFNGDSFTDLAIGIPYRQVNGTDEAGEVLILFGSEEGLNLIEFQIINQGANVDGFVEQNDRFGSPLISGDFNNDDFADLAIGGSNEHISVDGIDYLFAGNVTIFYGGENGLRVDNELVIHQGLNNVDGLARPFSFFGEALESGDFNGDRIDDLAVGIIGHRHPSNNDSVGAVMIFFGTDSGLSLDGEQRFQQGIDGVKGVPESLDRFGSVLAVGDFDGNNVDDLAISATFESVGEIDHVGAVSILYGSVESGGLSSDGNQIFHPGQGEVWGEPQVDEGFGEALAAADFDGDGNDDLAISRPDKTVSVSRQGVVQVFYSDGTALSTEGQQVWSQDNLQDEPETGDRFGSAIATADFNADGHADLAIGTPAEAIQNNSLILAGLVHIVYGESSGLSEAENQIWTQNMFAFSSNEHELDRFGWSFSR